MKQFNREKGRVGEDIAANYLIEKGFSILYKNHQTRFGEIDIIASINRVLVFVEVKAKTGEDFGMPEEMINKSKIRQIINTAQMFILTNQKLGFEKYRIDAVAIVLDENKKPIRIKHYENLNLEFL